MALDLKEEEAIGGAIDTHWYYVSKARMMAAHLARLTGGGPAAHVLDVGAGGGWFSRWLLREGLAARATCVDPGYPEDRDEAEAGRPLAFRRRVGSTDADLVLMMDVLEHVPDDVALLSEYLDAARPGTPVFVTVPAFAFLWSAHDVYLEHHRRYTAPMLRGTIEGAGARVERLHYFFGTIFPLAAAIRLATRNREATRSDMRPAPAPVNAALKAVLAAERQVMELNRLAGLSVVAVCRRGGG